MGRLIILNEIDLDATWYFSDAWLDSSSRRYRFDWPSPDYPVQVCMQQDEIYRKNSRKIEIRRWIENNITGPVIMDTIDKSYKKYYGKSYEWDKHYDVNNVWYRFHFEDSESALAFSLKFNDWIRVPTDWHPKRPEDEEYLALPHDKRYQE